MYTIQLVHCVIIIIIFFFLICTYVPCDTNSYDFLCNSRVKANNTRNGTNK